MQLEFLNNIYDNLIASRAVLTNLDHRKPDAVYCLAHLAGYNVWPDESINTMCKRGKPAIAENYFNKGMICVS